MDPKYIFKMQIMFYVFTYFYSEDFAVEFQMQFLIILYFNTISKGFYPSLPFPNTRSWVNRGFCCTFSHTHTQGEIFLSWRIFDWRLGNEKATEISLLTGTIFFYTYEILSFLLMCVSKVLEYYSFPLKHLLANYLLVKAYKISIFTANKQNSFISYQLF